MSIRGEHKKNIMKSFLIFNWLRVRSKRLPRGKNPTGKKQNIGMEMNKSKTLYSRNDEGLVIGRPVAKLALLVPISRSLHTCKRWNRLNWLFVVHYYCFFCWSFAEYFFQKKNNIKNLFYFFIFTFIMLCLLSST